MNRPAAADRGEYAEKKRREPAELFAARARLPAGADHQRKPGAPGEAGGERAGRRPGHQPGARAGRPEAVGR